MGPQYGVAVWGLSMGSQLCVCVCVFAGLVLVCGRSMGSGVVGSTIEKLGHSLIFWSKSDLFVKTRKISECNSAR